MKIREKIIQLNWRRFGSLFIHLEVSQKSNPCDQGTKIGIPKVFQRIPKNSSTNICGVPRNSDSYPPNTLAIRVKIILQLLIKLSKFHNFQIHSKNSELLVDFELPEFKFES